jgi:hypothetical protein
VKIKVEFEVIDIMDECDPYPTLSGIKIEEEGFENNVVLNLKKRKKSFEKDTLHVVMPLDPYEGYQYNEIVDEDAWSYVIENIYKIT